VASSSVTPDQSVLLLDDEPLPDVDAYRSAGGGQGLAAAHERGPEAVIDEVDRSGLRGRGGAGFPTGLKWRSVANHPWATHYMVCNAAEGEPGTFKDRWLIRHNPYLVLEGLAIAAFAVGAAGAFVALKASFEQETARLRRAAGEMRAAGLLGDVPIEIVTGPEDYLFGEEKAMLEVVEGRLPLPRILPPYQVGLFAARGAPNPTAMNNAETLANVGPILREGADWFRRLGTDESPGTMLFTSCGDVVRPGVYELPLGTPLRTLLEEHAGGTPEGRAVKAVFPGASAGILPGAALDTPMAFETMKAAGSGLGSAGFIVYDETACMVAAAAAFSRFLAVESCGQCPACKQGCLTITEHLDRIEGGEGSDDDLDKLLSRCRSVTGGTRCALPDGEAVLVASVVEKFGEEFTAHVDRGCPSPRDLPIPKLADFDEDTGQFVYADQSPYEDVPDEDRADEETPDD